MKTKRMMVVVAAVALVGPALVLALDAPTGLSATVGADSVVFDWDDVPGAVKYSVDVEGVVTYYDALLPGEVQVEVEVSFGTSDRTDGGEMGDSNLTVLIDDIAAAIAAELGIPVEDVLSLDGWAKVKALAPGHGAGSQNSPFSNPSVELDLTF